MLKVRLDHGQLINNKKTNNKIKLTRDLIQQELEVYNNCQIKIY